MVRKKHDLINKIADILRNTIERRGTWFWMLLIAVIPVLLLYRILFLGELIRASDITSQYYWDVVNYGKHWFTPFNTQKWGPEVNFGMDGTGGIARVSLPWRLLTYMILPLPVSIGWEIVTHIIFAGIGTFIYSRAIGLNRFSSFLAAIFFTLSSEIITLINAGHVGKINTIAWTPWVFWALEKGLQEKRPFFFLATGSFLAVQFFELHWQIAFYTCLAVGLYFIFRIMADYFKNKDIKEGGKLIQYAIFMIIIFFAASSISFLPVYKWSKTTERAGGMATAEGMSWSMPPEELVTYLIPGFFGLSRKESGVDPGYIDIHYWGRMIFTQTTDYIGILPLVLAAVALLYRRNWYTKFFLFLSIFTMIVALGKYTPIYRFIYDYIPGFSTFRVPKMILFLFAFGVSVIAGFGAQWLFFDENERKTKRIKHVVYGLAVILLITAGLTIYAYLDMEGLIQAYKSDLTRAFRWKLPPDIGYQRFMNIIWGSVSFMAILGVVMVFLWLAMKERISKIWLMVFATIFFIADVWNVNGRFIVTTPWPEVQKTEVIKFLEKDKGLFRVATFAGEDSFFYTHYNISVISSYLAVSEKDFAEYRDRLDLSNNLLDLMNVKYVTLRKEDIGALPLNSIVMGKYIVVANNDPNITILQNFRHLPRAYPVHQVVVEKNRYLALNTLDHPQFKPREMVLLEEEPPQTFPSSLLPSSASKVGISKYSGDEITIQAEMAQDGFLVLSEKYYPGWKAYVDGKSEKIYKANYIMRAVYLPKGSHTVKFVFDPWAYKVGLWLSSITFLFLVGAVLQRLRLRSRSKISQP